MSDDPAPPFDPEGAGPDDVDGEPIEPANGWAPEAVVAQANAITRRTLTALVALLFAFGSCGIAYGVFRVAGGDGGDTGTPAPGPSSPSASASPSPSPSESVTPSPSGPGADLVISSLTQTLVVVQNVGADPAGRFVVSVGGQAFIVEGGLDPGQTATFTYPCRVGPLTGVADSTQRVEESDEANNARTAGPFDCQSPSVSPSVSPSPSGSPSPSPTNRLPDLVVEQITSTSITVANVGDAQAGSFVVDGRRAGTFNVPGLSPGGSTTVTFPCAAGNIIATVDATDRVAESSETNNTGSAGPFECPPDLVVSEIGLDFVTISNIGLGNAARSVVAINGQTFQVPAIPDGGKATINFQCFGGVLDVVADVFDEVAESNEGNNSATRNVGPCA